MSQHSSVDWSHVIKDPRFEELHRRKSRVLWSLMVLTVIYYFALPIGAGYYPEIFKNQSLGCGECGHLICPQSVCVCGGVVAWIYTKIANEQFDPLSEEICAAYTSKQ